MPRQPLCAHLAASLVLLVSHGFIGAEEREAGGPVFVFETGTPAWAGERIPLPPRFAPDLGWTGVEEIRFAPGMFEAGEPGFFSYVLVFLLQPGDDVGREALARELLTYYRGLSAAVMEGRGLTVDTSPFTIQVEEPGDAVLESPATAPDATAWRASLTWIEPFATQEQQVLHFELHTWEEKGRPVVLSCASPADPSATGGPWKDLRRIRSTFRFE